MKLFLEHFKVKFVSLVGQSFTKPRVSLSVPGKENYRRTSSVRGLPVHKNFSRGINKISIIIINNSNFCHPLTFPLTLYLHIAARYSLHIRLIDECRYSMSKYYVLTR